jgi:hypothetical protein
MCDSRKIGRNAKQRQGTAEKGVTMIETVVASFILLVAVTGALVPFRVVINQNKKQGELATRTTEYCQDKMEQLMALSFSDSATNTTVYPPTSTGGTGLGGTMAASATVGGTNLSSPTSGYVDYLDSSGNLLTSSAGSYYERVWSIATDSTAKLKTITVVTEAATTTGMQGGTPESTLVCIKASLQ